MQSEFSYLCRVKKADIVQFLFDHKESFRKDYGVIKLGLFGSVAKGVENPNDIDLIVEFEPGTKNLFEKKISLRKKIETKFKLPVDILREQFIKPYARQLILKDAQFI